MKIIYTSDKMVSLDNVLSVEKNSDSFNGTKNSPCKYAIGINYTNGMCEYLCFGNDIDTRDEIYKRIFKILVE